MYRIMSINLLCYGKGERDWKNRIPLVCKVIRETAPDSFGVQEAHIGWINALCENLPEYDYVGVGREDGKEEGEFAAVFYKKDKFTASDSGNFWISETPDRPSLGWDARCTRVATYVRLTDKATNLNYIHFNTHLDHIGDIARIEGAKMIQRKAASFAGAPVVCTGDFNIPQGTECYQTMISGNMADARTLAADSDDCFTFHGFEPENIHDIIDFIFVDPAHISPVSFKVINKKIDGDFYSDHNAIYSDMEIK